MRYLAGLPLVSIIIRKLVGTGGAGLIVEATVVIAMVWVERVLTRVVVAGLTTTVVTPTVTTVSVVEGAVTVTVSSMTEVAGTPPDSVTVPRSRQLHADAHSLKFSQLDGTGLISTSSGTGAAVVVVVLVVVVGLQRPRRLNFFFKVTTAGEAVTVVETVLVIVVVYSVSVECTVS